MVGQYTNSVEEQHAYIKETVDTIFPSNIRILQVEVWTHLCLLPAALTPPLLTTGGPGQGPAEDPEAGEGHPGPDGGLQGTLQDQVSHSCGVR